MQEQVWLIVYFFISSKFVLLQCQKAPMEFRMPLWEVLYGYDEGKPFYIEIQLEIQGLSVARSASDYFHLVQMILPLFSEYLSLYCSASLISDFPGSWGRWSVLFVMLNCISAKRAIWGKWHHQYTLCCRTGKLTLLLEIKTEASQVTHIPKTEETAKSWFLACFAWICEWGLFFRVFPLELDRVLFEKKYQCFQT